MTRPRFQLHLSTAIVLMFVAGGFIYLNTVRSPKFEYVFVAYSCGGGTKKRLEKEFHLDRVCCGWPVICCETPKLHEKIPHASEILANNITNKVPHPALWGSWHFGGLLLNILTLGTLLGVSGIICNRLYSTPPKYEMKNK
jgi:hypothetical protein